MIRNIQVLRGMAAMFVVFVHLIDAHVVSGVPAFGRGGVDLFFVISGFIMVQVDRTRHVPAGRFLVQRFARVAPLYYVMTLVVFTVALFRPSLLSSTTASVPDLMRSLLFLPYVKSNGLTQPVLFVGWTLNYEMFFYALFALSLLSRRRTTRLAVLAASILSLVAAGRAFHPETVLAAFYSSPLMLEFLVGVLLAEATALWQETFARIPRAFLLGAGVVASLCLFLMPMWRQPSGVLAPAALSLVIVGAAVALERQGWAVRRRTALELGNASYSIYLTHPFVIGAFAQVAGTAQFLSPKGLVLAIGAALLTAAVGWLCHILIERPLSAAVLEGMIGRPAPHPKTTVPSPSRP